MGAFFTNIQINNLNKNQSNFIGDVIESITKYNSELGYIKTEQEEDADKTIFIIASDNSNWLSVYDEELEDQDTRKLNKLSSHLSKQLKTKTLSVLVHDSDSMFVGLNINGVLKDKLSNLSKDIDFNKNKPSLWEELLIENHSFESIKNAWENKGLFVEDFLSDFANLINIEASNLLTGYEYLTEENRNNIIKLNFAKINKNKTPDLGPTKFMMLGGIGLIDVKEGEKQDTDWFITNRGISSIGVDIVIAGECVKKSLLIPEKVIASYHKKQRDKKDSFEANFVDTVSTTGEKIFYARLEDIYIPEGYIPPNPMTPKEAKLSVKKTYDCIIKFNLSFIGGQEGEGNFTIFFSPLVNRQEGSFSWELTKGKLKTHY